MTRLLVRAPGLVFCFFWPGEVPVDLCNEREISIVVKCLASLSNPPSDIQGLSQKMLEGQCLDLVGDLYLDSLGSMEFCIQAELELGLVITPEDLIDARTSDELLKIVRRLNA